jgi:rubredoxin-NAD+ reductase
MSKWECIVCGLIYDEKEGWPDDGIAPGTKWADVPEDWLCPDCGVGKEDFELLEEAAVEAAPHHEEPVVDKEHAPIVILGLAWRDTAWLRNFANTTATHHSS